MRREVPLILNRVAGQKSWLAHRLETPFIRPRYLGESFWSGSQHVEPLLLACLRKEGVRAQPFYTERPGHATEIARRLAKEGADLIITAGGDGTVNEAVNGMAGSEATLGIIPLGTANSFAIELGIPFSIEGASQVIARGRVRRVDLGRAGDRFFAMGAGVSFCAHVIQRIRPGLKRLFGGFAYLLQGTLEAFNYSFPVLEVESEEGSRNSTGYLVIVANARFYGGYFRVAPRALLDDGLLDILVLKKKGIWNLWRYVLQMRYGEVSCLRDIESFQARRVRVSSDRPLPLHLDAEIYGTTPCDFECIPRVFRVLCPTS